MAVIDSKKKEIHFKIVYYGPGRSGKTTSIEKLQALIQSPKKSKVKKSSDNDKTIFFDFLALSSESIGEYQTKIQVYTVPGQVLYEDSRKILLKGVDGIIFVVDSQIDKIQENLDCLEELRTHLKKLGYNPKDIPIILQYNKRDLPEVPPVDELRRVVNIHHYPEYESVAKDSQGVLDAFQECLRQVVLNLKD